VVVVRSGDYTIFKVRAHTQDDVAILLLSPAALDSRKIVGIAEMLRPHEHWRPRGRSIVLLDRVSSSTARELVGPDATLLTLRSPGETADEIARILPILRGRRGVLRVLLIVARPAALPLLDPRRSVAPIAEALAGLEAQIDLHVLVRPSFREIVREIHDAHADGQPFQILHVDAHAAINEKGQTCLALDGVDELSVPLVRFAGELYLLQVVLCILDLHWPISADTSGAELRARGLLQQVGIQSVILPVCSSTTHREFIAGLYETIVAGEAVESEHGSVAPLVSDLRPARQVSSDDGIPTIDNFVDRFAELLELDDALRRHSIIVIHGDVGVGKSALAAELARWQRQMRRFDEVIWLTPESVQDGLEFVALRQLVAGEPSLREILDARALLVVLDAWDEWRDRSILNQLAGVGQTRILITAREPPDRVDCFSLQLSSRP
jgi:hypothetical protein